MKTIELDSADASARAIADGQVGDVVVLRNGRPVAIVVPFDADDLSWYAAETDPAFIRSIATARAQVAARQTVSHEQLLAE